MTLRQKGIKSKGKEPILCGRIYNEYKCWRSTGCCKYLMEQKKCPSFISKYAKKNKRYEA